MPAASCVILRMLSRAQARCTARLRARAGHVRAAGGLRCRRHRADARRWYRRTAQAWTCWPASIAGTCARLRSCRSACSSCCRCCPGRCRGWPRAGSPRQQDARRVAAAGYEMALVGSALMRGGDPQGTGGRPAGRRAGPPRCGSRFADSPPRRRSSAALEMGVGRGGLRVRRLAAAADTGVRGTSWRRPARGRARCVAVARHPVQAEIDEMLQVFAPDVLQGDLAELAGAAAAGQPGALPVLRAVNTAPAALPGRILFESAVSGSGARADWDARRRAGAAHRAGPGRRPGQRQRRRRHRRRAAVRRGCLQWRGRAAGREEPRRDQRNSCRPRACCRYARE